MTLRALINTGTKVWLDGVEVDKLKKDAAAGITGATSNPAIIFKIIATGAYDSQIDHLIANGIGDEEIAWQLNDELVTFAERIFLPVWQETNKNDGYVSFELDPLIEDERSELKHWDRVERYIELGKKWSSGHKNRMIKVPASQAGLEALEPLAAAGVKLNVTLMFTQRQYQTARDAIWRGAQQSPRGLNNFKSVYSIFVSRVDLYTSEKVLSLSPGAQGIVGIVNAKRIWRENVAFWSNKGLRLKQEIVFASTGVKHPGEPPDKYVEALAGSDIQTNPPDTNDAVERLGKTYIRRVEELPCPYLLDEIDHKVDMAALETSLMKEGLRKFAELQRNLIALIAHRRAQRSPRL